MRLVRRALAGAGASLALGALFATSALGAEPTTASAEADATLNLGSGAEDTLGLDATLDGIAGVTDEASATDAGADVDVTAGAGGGPAETTAGSATVDADAAIDIGASQASLAGTGSNAGSVLLIDLDAGRHDAVDGSAGLQADVGLAASDASGRAGFALLVAAAGPSAASAGGAADVAIGSGPEVASGFAAGTGAGTGADAAILGFVDAEGVLGIQGAGTVGAADGSVAAGAPPAENGTLAPAGAATAAIGSLPDTAFGMGAELAFWGLLLVVLAGLALARRLPARRT